MNRSTLLLCYIGLVIPALTPTIATAQAMPKPQVASLITRVENGVDEFRNYLEKRGENARDANTAAQSSGRRKARGSYGAEAARLWAALRTGINNLARAYGVQPLAI